MRIPDPCCMISRLLTAEGSRLVLARGGVVLGAASV